MAVSSSVLAFSPEGEGGWLDVGVHTDDDRVRAGPFDAIELELAALWADVRVG
jgi:hypothetical protein